MAFICLCIAVLLLCIPGPVTNPQLLRWIAFAFAIVAMVLGCLDHTGEWWPAHR